VKSEKFQIVYKCGCHALCTVPFWAVNTRAYIQETKQKSELLDCLSCGLLEVSKANKYVTILVNAYAPPMAHTCFSSDGAFCVPRESPKWQKEK
jgi:hypothetical protein